MGSEEDTGPRLPSHETAPPPVLSTEYKSRERDEDRQTRKPLGWWDRVKILVLLLGGWGVLFWGAIADNPLLSLRDAFIETVRTQAWILGLAALELIRQLHYFISEHWARYHRYWTKKVFAGFQRRTGRMNDWNRYRVSRAMKWLFWLIILDLVLAKILNEPPATALIRLPAVILQALPLILQVIFILIIAVGQFVAIFWFLSRGGVDVYFPDDIKTRFTDVWGQDKILEKVKENMVFLEDPESIEEKGGYVPGGVLLWGPPGTGKTLMAEAVAGETGKPFVFVEPGAFINMFFGVGVLKVKGLFRKLRKLAVRYGGVIAFFDEADALGNRGAMQGGTGPWNMTPNASEWVSPSCNGVSYMAPRTAWTLLQHSLEPSGLPEPRRRVIDRVVFGGMGMGGGGMGTLQALLTELSGLKKPRGFFNRIVRRALGMRPKPPPKYRILVMMATNMPQALDEALLRPGRIDRIYKVGYPSKSGRVRTYVGYLEKVKHNLTADDIDKLATMTPYATGATIKDMVNEALVNAIRDGREVIEWRDMIKAKQLKDLGPPEDVEYIERERHAVAVHEACHAVAAYRIRQHLTIDIATIEKGGTYLGMVAAIPPEDQFTHWRSEYEADIMTALASLAGERMFYDGDSSSGVSGDLENATMLATLMEGYWGMGSTVASHGITHQVGIGGGGKPGQQKGKKDKDLLESNLGSRIEGKLEELLGRAKHLLAENRLQVLGVAHALETNKTVTGEDVEAIIEGREGTLLDGRPYHAPEVAAMLEEYHVAAVEAHRLHSRPTMPLPALTPRFDPEPAGTVQRSEEAEQDG